MQHFLFFDGNDKRIAWVIQTPDTIIEQKREHPDIYLNKVTRNQSKFIALHVGLFWGIGRFIIKNNDSVTIKIDEKTIFYGLTKNEKFSDELIKDRIKFFTQLIMQRKLKINYELVEKAKNLASPLI